MGNTVNFVKAIQKQTPKQMEVSEEMNGLIATLLSNTQVEHYYEYRNNLDSLEAISKVMDKYPQTRKLVDSLAQLTYQSYVSHRKTLEKECSELSNKLAITDDYKKAYNHFKSSNSHNEEEIPL